MEKYRIEHAHWVEGSGYAYNETIDNTDDLLTADQLAEDYGEYCMDGDEIRLINNKSGEIIAFAEIVANKVINKNGTEINLDAAVNLMDDEIREELASIGFDTEQEFFTAYEKAHEEKYGEEWELSKENPTW